MHPTPDTDTAAEAPAHRAAGGRHSAGPVFLDDSGRRQRRFRRIGRLLVVPAAGYVALLVSAALGGPTVSVPYLPGPAHHQRPVRPAASAAAGRHAGKPAAPGTAGSAAAVSGPSAPGAPAPTLTPSAAPPAGPSTAPGTPVASPSHGKSTATHPVPSHTTHGRASH